MEKQKYIFYCGESNKAILPSNNLDKDYVFKIWRPKIYRIAPKGSDKEMFFWCFVWWIFHYLRVFKNSNYSIFIIYSNITKEIAHYSVVMPRYFRSSFMGKDDLQIGPIGTSEKHRRKGLASYGIEKIIEFYRNKNIRFWYLVREENIPSRKCIENFGFTIYGEGTKVGKLKRYIIEKKY